MINEETFNVYKDNSTNIQESRRIRASSGERITSTSSKRNGGVLMLRSQKIRQSNLMSKSTGFSNQRFNCKNEGFKVGVIFSF